MKAKILFTIPNFITAGSGEVLLNIAKRLDPNKFSPTICVMKKGGKLDKEIEKIGIPFFEAPFAIEARPRRSLLLRAYKAAKVFKPYKFDIWHSFHYLDDYTEPIIAKLSGVKNWIYTKKSMSWGTRAWKARSYLATRIVVDNSEMEEAFFNKQSLRKKIKLIHHGVVTDLYGKNKILGLDTRKKFGLSEKSFLVVCTSHLSVIKGQDVLLKAAAQIPNINLIFAGRAVDEDYVKQLKKIIRELKVEGRVKFIGNIDNIPEFLAQADVFVLPTKLKGRVEGCPLALLEAMASELPCVATDIPGVRDIIVKGKNGFLVEPENVSTLAGVLRELISDEEKRKEVSKNARECIKNNFSIEKEVRAHEELYEELLKRKKR